MAFLERLRGGIKFDLFGRGFQQNRRQVGRPGSVSVFDRVRKLLQHALLDRKGHDCFLTWTMPIYFGCTALENYFPADSFVRIDPDSSDVLDHIREIIAGDLRERNLAAIAEARRRVLYEHNLLEFLTREIERAEAARPSAKQMRVPILIRNHTLSLTRCAKLEVREQLRRAGELAQRQAR